MIKWRRSYPKNLEGYIHFDKLRSFSPLVSETLKDKGCRVKDTPFVVFQKFLVLVRRSAWNINLMIGFDKFKE